MLMEENKPLAPFTTFGIGGPARWFVEAASEDEIVEATGWARERGAGCLCWAAGATCWSPMRGSMGWCCAWGCMGLRFWKRTIHLPASVLPGLKPRLILLA